MEFRRKKGGWVGAISTDTILSPLVATSRILVPHYRRDDRVMLWPLIKNVVSCVCKPPSCVQHPEPFHPAALSLLQATANRFMSVLRCGANRGTPLERLYSNHIEVTLSQNSCSTPFVGITTQVADNVEKYSALSDQPGEYAVRGEPCVTCQFHI